MKVYVHDSAQHPERKYSAPHFASAVRRPITGQPEMELVSTSHVERLNATTRLHMKRLTRLTLAFSKKLENFEAAVGLHFAYYNFVKRHNTLRCTPAMAAGIERDFWSVGQLVEAYVYDKSNQAIDSVLGHHRYVGQVQPSEHSAVSRWQTQLTSAASIPSKRRVRFAR